MVVYTFKLIVIFFMHVQVCVCLHFDFQTLFVISTIHICGKKCLWNNGVGLLGKKCKQF